MRPYMRHCSMLGSRLGGGAGTECSSCPKKSQIMCIIRQLLLLVVLFVVLERFCDAAVILTNSVVEASPNQIHLNQEFDASPQFKMDLIINVPFQRVNTGDNVILQLNLERTVEGAITMVTSFGPDSYVISGNIANGKIDFKPFCAAHYDVYCSLLL